MQERIADSLSPRLPGKGLSALPVAATATMLMDGEKVVQDDGTFCEASDPEMFAVLFHPDGLYRDAPYQGQRGFAECMAHGERALRPGSVQ